MTSYAGDKIAGSFIGIEILLYWNDIQFSYDVHKLTHLTGLLT